MTQPVEVLMRFQPKSGWQKPDCINQNQHYRCDRLSTLELAAGTRLCAATIRCCDNPSCKADAVKRALCLFPNGTPVFPKGPEIE